MKKMSFVRLVVGASVVLATVGVQAAVVLSPGKSWRSEAFPVKEGAQYGFSIRARIDGETTLEKNPQLSVGFYDADRRRKGFSLPEWSVEFRTADGKPTPLYATLTSPWRVMMFGAWHDYPDVFNAPWGAATATIVCINRSGHDTVEFEPPTLKAITSPYVNANPDFALGDVYCHAGYGQGGMHTRMHMEKRKDGQGKWLVPEARFEVDPIPVRGGHDYGFNIKMAADCPVFGFVQVRFLDEKGQKLPHCGGDMYGKAEDKDGSEGNFIAPPAAKYMTIYVPSKKQPRYYEHIRITDKGVAK